MLLISAGRLSAHPGHDDGHELTWELRHLAEHPFATAGWVALISSAGFAIWLMQRRRPAAVQDLRTSQPSRGK